MQQNEVEDMFHVPEKFRVTEGELRSVDGNNGAFCIIDVQSGKKCSWCE